MSDHTPDFTVVGEEWARGPRSRNSVISSVSEPEACLEAEARAFADKIGDSWAEPHRTPPTCGLGPRVQTLDPSRRAENGRERGGVPLQVKGAPLAWLRLTYSCRPDNTGKYLAVDGSKFWILSTKDRTPLIRFEYEYEYEYEYDGRTTPHSHIHVHAERGVPCTC